MINPEEIRLSTLPWMPLDATAAFPQRPAIYFAIDSSDVVQYIGLASNAKRRWLTHDRREELASLEDVRVAFLFVESTDLLAGIEAVLIRRFNPPLNKIGKVKRPLKEQEINSWGDVARYYEVHTRTIQRDREAFGREFEPINPDLLNLIAKMRRCVDAGYSRRTVVGWHLNNQLDKKIEEISALLA